MNKHVAFCAEKAGCLAASSLILHPFTSKGTLGFHAGRHDKKGSPRTYFKMHVLSLTVDVTIKFTK